jgi:P-type Ca2+ transporter type 2C
VFWRPAQLLFHFGQLHWDDLAVCMVAGFFSLLLLETIKSLWFRGGSGDGKARAPRQT